MPKETKDNNKKSKQPKPNGQKHITPEANNPNHNIDKQSLGPNTNR